MDNTTAIDLIQGFITQANVIRSDHASQVTDAENDVATQAQAIADADAAQAAAIAAADKIHADALAAAQADHDAAVAAANAKTTADTGLAALEGRIVAQLDDVLAAMQAEIAKLQAPPVPE